MLPALVCAAVVAPLFWLLVPERFRREALVALSLAGLAYIDPRLPLLTVGVTVLVYVAVRAARGWWIALPGLAALAFGFAWNKMGGSGGLLPSQGGLVLLGGSYIVLKASAALVDAARGSLREASFVDVLGWIVFLPAYTSGPIEEFDHFRRQQPVLARDRIFGGLERILFGLVKTMLLSHYLGVWMTPVFADPSAQGSGVLLVGAWATALRFYFDFSGYSDIAIGVAALFGIELQENFDNPLVRRNLAQLWQRWHMTLTRWLRRYLFMPISRGILTAGGRKRDTLALVTAQLVTMTFCGLWHGLGWNFLLWGVLQAVGLIWVGRPARVLGGYLPTALRTFWRHSRVGYALSTLITFHYFAFSNVLVFAGTDGSVDYLKALLGG